MENDADLDITIMARLLALVSIALYFSTVAIFGYLMILPARGVQVDYFRWQKDSHLQALIPLMTAFIVAGYVTMVITLSPLCAPSPPSPALSQRLLEAAKAAGGNLQKASSGIQLLLSDAARSMGIGSSNTDLDTSSLLKAFRLPDGEALAGRLGVSKDHAKVLISTLERYQTRAQAWKENNVSVLGWTGALLGSASAYTFMFGIVGLFGLISPRNAKPKRATL